MMKINNNKELWSEWMGGEETEETSKALLRKWVFKGTECGCVFKSDEKGIMVGGYNELGESAELPTYDLKWGFTIEEFNEALEYADKEGVEAWNEANDEDEEGSFLEKLGSFVLSEKEVQRRNQDMITEEEWKDGTL
tara:strand:+ start:36 stop:446 length:411 start_codon:yes stop_codon:yes gene_type:complete